MDELHRRLAAIEGRDDPTEVTKARKAPAGWEPGVVWDGTAGMITTAPVFEPPGDWDEVLRARGLDPEVFEVVGDTLKWCSYDGWRRDEPGGEAYSALCYSFRAEIRRKHSPTAIPEDVYLDARRARKAKKAPESAESAFVVCLSDWQLGNKDNGGLDDQLQKLADLPDQLVARVKALRKAGNPVGEILIAGLGDLVESTCGFYPAQQFRIALDRRDQVKVVRRALRDIVMAVAPLAEKVTVCAVAGNHGENRSAGKAFTSPNDNDDVAVFEQVAEILAQNPEAFGHVGFRLPRERIAVSVSAGGKIVAFTHGHVPKPKGGPVPTMWEWWKNQAHGRAYPGIADADILVTGHFHHLNLKEQEGRVLFITPSLTRVGEYWADANGTTTRAGTLTFLVNPNGWSDLTIL